ncbi:MAG TPA: EamA family transporter [Chryseosolibacter sp.]
MTTSHPSKILIGLAFFAIYFIWGTTYLAVLWGLEGMEPFVLSSLRYTIAGILMSVFCFVSKYSWPDLKATKTAFISGTIMLVGGTGLVALSEKYIGSGHAAVVIATEPLWFLILDKKRWKEYLKQPRVIFGLIIGFLGVVLFSYFTSGDSGSHQNELTGTLVTLAASVLWVVGALYYEKSKEAKRHPHVVMVAIQLSSAGLMSALIALLLGEWMEFSVSAIGFRAWAGLGFLVTMGSIVAFMAFTWLMKVQPPAVVSTHTYVNPVVAVFIGWLFADEQITGIQFFSLVIVLIGVLLTQLPGTRKAG